MISAAGVPAVTNPIRVPSASASGDTSSTVAAPAAPTSSREPDVLSLSQPDSQPASDGSYQRTSLQIRAHSHVRVDDDGDVRSMTQAKLRFRYEFEAADGTKIRIRAEANLRYSQISDNDYESQSIKLRTAARVSVVQGNVSSGMSSLLGSSEASDDAKSAISQALGLFQQATEAVTSAFLESDPLDGDGLITGMVEAFNGLSEAVDAIFRPAPSGPETLPPAETPSTPETLPPAETGELPEQAPTAPAPVESGDVVAAEPESSETNPPAEVETSPVAELPSQETLPTGETPSDPVENVGQTDSPAVEIETLPTAGEVPVVTPTTSEPAGPVARSVMVKLRMQVMQSLRSLVGEFDSGSSRLLVAQSSLRASAQFSVRYNTPGLTTNGTSTPDDRIDTQV